MKKMGLPTGQMFIWSKLGQNPSEMNVRTFAKIKNLFSDQLLATKAEIIQIKAVSFCIQNEIFVSFHFRREYLMR